MPYNCGGKKLSIDFARKNWFIVCDGKIHYFRDTLKELKELFHIKKITKCKAGKYIVNDIITETFQLKDTIYLYREDIYYEDYYNAGKHFRLSGD